MLEATTVTHREPRAYATGADFCWIFMRNMERLYLLSYLLTGAHSMAEKCFVAGLDASVEQNRVFKEWAESWARRTIVQNAIRMMAPRPGESEPGQFAGQRIEAARILALPAFERFVFVMSVFEGYSDQECSLLLHCGRNEVTTARAQALQRIGTSVNPTVLSETALNQEAFSRLAASA